MASFLDTYVLGAGWVMLLLVPASVVSVATLLRCAAAYRASAVAGDGDSAAARVVARLHALREAQGGITAQDVREETDQEVLELYALLQPAHVVSFVSPLLGLLAGIIALLPAVAAPARGADAAQVGLMAHQALVAIAWGVGVGLVAFVGFAILRARLWHMENEHLRPAVEAAARDMLRPVGGFRPRRDTVSDDWSDGEQP